MSLLERVFARHVISACFSSSLLRQFCSSTTSQPWLPEVAVVETHQIEDLPRKSLFEQFRKNRVLTVTDIICAEWCEKKTEFELIRGKPGETKAMIIGSLRHEQLEKDSINSLIEDTEMLKIPMISREESWVWKFIKFVVGAKKLHLEGVTREIPVMGVVSGIWISGRIDEIRVQKDEKTNNAILVDTKTRVKPTTPSEAQKRNARLQLMCYKCLWDNLIINQFPFDDFFTHFDFDSEYILSDSIKEYITSSGFQAKTLGDVVTYFRNTLSILPKSKEELLLRYELQEDNSLLKEYTFSYDQTWFEDQMRRRLNFWIGGKEANFVSPNEKWKCRFCDFKNECPNNNETFKSI